MGMSHGPSPVDSPRTAQAAIQLALSRLQPAGPAFHERAKCVSCHHQSLPAIAVALAERRGVTVDRPLTRHPTEATLAGWRLRKSCCSRA